MAKDHERVGWLSLGEECGDPPPERASDKGDAFVALAAERIARGTEIFDLRCVVLAGSRPPCAERDRPRGDLERLECRCKRAEDALLRCAAVSGREDRGPLQAGGFGSFCARPSDGPRRSPTASRRADMLIIVKASGRPSEAISSHRSGAETGARRIGRTLYGPAVDFARVFCR